MEKTIKALNRIYKKYHALEHNEENYELGGGRVDYKFASVRHEDAKSDTGKLTLGQANQMFKKATGLHLDVVKDLIEKTVPNMEWHHAGRLPKRYGGGMKKTYFLKSHEIVACAIAFGFLFGKTDLKPLNYTKELKDGN